MGSFENPNNWILDCPLIDDIPLATAVDFAAPADGFYWSSQGFNTSSNARNVCANISVEVNCSFADSDGLNESGASRKRVKSDSNNRPGPKACREKIRRDKLNDRFLELGSILDPGKPPKMDKAAILGDATRMVSQLRTEAQKLKDSNESLQEKIKELKEEKNELREEKQRLKGVKDNLEQQIKIMNGGPRFIRHPPIIPTSAFTPQGGPTGHKMMMPVIGYPGFPMWQFMPPTDVDTSQDAESCPPVA